MTNARVKYLDDCYTTIILPKSSAYTDFEARANATKVDADLMITETTCKFRMLTENVPRFAIWLLSITREVKAAELPRPIKASEIRAMKKEILTRRCVDGTESVKSVAQEMGWDLSGCYSLCGNVRFSRASAQMDELQTFIGPVSLPVLKQLAKTRGYNECGLEDLVYLQRWFR